jgi:hypothetical protein
MNNDSSWTMDEKIITTLLCYEINNHFPVKLLPIKIFFSTQPKKSLSVPISLIVRQPPFLLSALRTHTRKVPAMLLA